MLFLGMTTIFVPSRIESGFGQGLSEFLKIVDHISELDAEEPLEFNMTGCKFLTPFFVLPLVLFIKQERLKRQIDCNPNFGVSFRNYADLISFPNGLKPENIIGGDYESYLDKYSLKNFIPIIDFPAARNSQATNIRDTFLNV